MCLDESRFHRCLRCGGPGRLRQHHPQVHVVDDVQQACVDELLAPLLRYLWAGGCSTVASCQASRRDGDSEDWAHITFADGHSFDAGVQQLWRFCRGQEPALRTRLADMGSGTSRPPGVWQHSLFVYPERRLGDEMLRLYHLLELPTSDLIAINEVFSQVDKGDPSAADGSRSAWTT